MNGYTYEPTAQQRIQNLLASLRKRVTPRELVDIFDKIKKQANGDIHLTERILTGELRKVL